MKFSIGDKSLIFKYISKNLKNIYDSTLVVSNEYTLELAKCIYNYLRDNFPQQDIIIGDKLALSENICDYYLCGNPLVDNLVQFEADEDYIYNNGTISFIGDRYPNDGSAIYVYYNNNKSEKFILKTFSSDKPFIIIADNPDTITDVYVVDFINLGYISSVPNDNLSLNELGARIYIKTDAENDIYDTNYDIMTFSIDDINKYNLKDWPIDDQIIQYLHPGVVVCSQFSSIDEIAIIQNLMSSIDMLDYYPAILGEIDENFKTICYEVQHKLMKNKNILATGYFDTYAESFIRNLSEVRR